MQMLALFKAAARELAWGLPAVAREISAWRRYAQAIPDMPLREDAVSSLARKRANADGAALFWTLPRQRNRHLLRLLVAYQTMWDYLDDASECGASAGEANGLQLHAALAAAFEPDMPTPDHYRLHPWQDDGGYLDTLVRVCREQCAHLPSFESIRAGIREATCRCEVQALNHNPRPKDRELALQAWAERECEDREAPWFELTAAASASVTPHVLLALAAEALPDEHELTRVADAYYWVSLSIAMLDSYADLVDDQRRGDHSYISHYPRPDLAARRLVQIVDQTTRSVGALENGHRHTVIAGCIVAMYLSKRGAGRGREGTGKGAGVTSQLARAGGSLTTLLLPILRLWRAIYALRTA
jgi:tetraprenyl-beta-curcumene synthase